MRNRIRIFRVFAWLAWGAVTVSIFLFSAQNADESSQVSLGLLHRILGVIVPGFDTMSVEERVALLELYHSLIRKAAHFTIYLVWGGILSMILRSYRCGWKPVLALVCTAGLLYAGSDELHQSFVSGRSGQVSDVLLDTTGVFVGYLVMRLGTWLYRLARNHF